MSIFISNKSICLLEYLHIFTMFEKVIDCRFASTVDNNNNFEDINSIYQCNIGGSHDILHPLVSSS